MEFIESFYGVVPEIVWELISFVGSASAILFLYFSSKYRNHELAVKWYIFAFFFPLITTIVYFSKRKRYDRNIGVKVCPSCGDKCPPNFQICSRCLVELPEIDEKKNGLYKKLSTAFLVLFIVLFLFDTVSGTVVVNQVMKEMPDIMGDYEVVDNEYPERIAFEDKNGDAVYYDRNAEACYDSLDLPLYDKEGNLYYFTYESGQMYFYKDDGSQWNEANLLDGRYCFVDEDGFFVYFYGDEPVRIVEEGKEYNYYFDAPCTDGKGKLYYPAISASWNEKGELITSSEQLGE